MLIVLYRFFIIMKIRSLFKYQIVFNKADISCVGDIRPIDSRYRWFYLALALCLWYYET
jgi:hypothetical protein